jgi:hypothetical protein
MRRPEYRRTDSTSDGPLIVCSAVIFYPSSVSIPFENEPFTAFGDLSPKIEPDLAVPDQTAQDGDNELKHVPTVSDVEDVLRVRIVGWGFGRGEHLLHSDAKRFAELSEHNRGEEQSVTACSFFPALLTRTDLDVHRALASDVK